MKIKLLKPGREIKIKYYSYPHTISEIIDNKIKYIDAIQLFTDFHFLVSPKGKFQSVGFGVLMLHLNIKPNLPNPKPPLI